MKPFILIGIALIAFGVIALAYQSITYTAQAKFFKVGPPMVKN